MAGLPLWYTLARRAAALLSRAGDASPTPPCACAALERAAHSKAVPSGAVCVAFVQSSVINEFLYRERREGDRGETNKKTTHREHLAGESVGDGPRARRPRRQRPRPRFANSESRESPREAPCVAQRRRRCRVGSESELSDLRCEHILGLHGGFAQGGRSLPS